MVQTPHRCVVSGAEWPQLAATPGTPYPGSGGLQAGGGVGRGPTRAWLVALDGVHRGEDFRLVEGVNKIGSSYLADIALTGPGVSGVHALIRCQGMATDIRDFASHEGLLVNGESLSEGLLVDGDEVTLGSVRLLFRLAAPFAPGYRPELRPRPLVKTTPSVHIRSYLCGWLVQARPGPLASDFRLINGTNRIGRHEDNAIILSHVGVDPHHAVITCAKNRCLIAPVSMAQTVVVHQTAIAEETELFDSDLVILGGVEFYVKWL